MTESRNQIRSPEKTKRVCEAFLIYDVQPLADLNAIEFKKASVKSFSQNALDGLRKVTSAGSLPFQLVSHSVHHRRFDLIHTAERIRSLKDVQAGEEPSEEQKEKSFEIAK